MICIHGFVLSRSILPSHTLTHRLFALPPNRRANFADIQKAGFGDFVRSKPALNCKDADPCYWLACQTLLLASFNR